MCFISQKCYDVLRREWIFYTSLNLLSTSQCLSESWFHWEYWHIFYDCIMNSTVDTIDDEMNLYRQIHQWTGMRNRHQSWKGIWQKQQHNHHIHKYEINGQCECVNEQEQEHNFQIITVSSNPVLDTAQVSVKHALTLVLLLSSIAYLFTTSWLIFWLDPVTQYSQLV